MSTPAASNREALSLSPVIDSFYQPGVLTDVRDAADRLSSVLDHLLAQLAMISGGGYENFMSYSEQIQANYLYGCSKQAQEAVDLLRIVHPAVYRSEH